MSEFAEIVKLSESETVELSKAFKEKIHTHLVLGHTRYLVRHSILGEGHKRLGDYRYYMCIREMYNRAMSIDSDKHQAMIVQADLMDAQKKLKDAEERNDGVEMLRQKGVCGQKKNQLMNMLVHIEDKSRELDELEKIYKEMQPVVDKKYPGGIEEYEAKHWREVYEYERKKAELRGEPQPNLAHIPLDPASRIKAATYWKQDQDLVGLQINYQDTMRQIASETEDEKEVFQKFLEHVGGENG